MHGVIGSIILLAALLISGPIDAREIRGQVATGDFEWNAQTFPGFYYDVDRDLGTEKITTYVTYGKLEEPNGLVYSTTAQRDDLKFADWGSYNVIGFLGEKYFAGYAENENVDESNQMLLTESTDENSLSHEQIQTILMDSNAETTVTASQPLKLEEGYELAIKYIDSSGMLVELTKNGKAVDSKVLMPSKVGATMADKTYLYRTDEDEQMGLVTIAVHFKNAVAIQNQTVATADGLWQISDTPTPVKIDAKFGKMRISSVSADTIVLDNKDYNIALSKNRDIELLGNIWIRTADQDVIDDMSPLRYYIYLDEKCEC
ncbi:MAG: S-layer protein domain-containing protein [Methanothrix sp.]|nr:S-layer protein domain-containing protein [Methanothrix sp.]